VEWDTVEAARKYFVAYRTQLQKKWKQFHATSETEDAIDGTGDEGHFQLRRKGAVVTSIEGLP